MSSYSIASLDVVVNPPSVILHMGIHYTSFFLLFVVALLQIMEGNNKLNLKQKICMFMETFHLSVWQTKLHFYFSLNCTDIVHLCIFPVQLLCCIHCPLTCMNMNRNGMLIEGIAWIHHHCIASEENWHLVRFILSFKCCWKDERRHFESNTLHVKPSS